MTRDPSVTPGRISQVRRRSRRVATELWWRVLGVHPSMILSRGDLCATGVYLAAEAPIGSPGDVVMLGLATSDKSTQVQTLARVARVIRQDDRGSSARMIGVAFEFLPLDEVTRGTIELLTSATQLELIQLGEVRLDDPAPARIHAEGPPIDADLIGLSGHRLMLTTHGDIEPDSTLRAEIEHAQGISAVTGIVSGYVPGRGPCPHRVEVTASGPPQVEQLLSLAAKLVMPGELTLRKGAARDFHGDLGRLGIDQILSFLRQEQYSGVLSAADPGKAFSLEISNGEVATCEDSRGQSHEDVLQDVMSMSEGEFRFRYHRSAQLDELGAPAARLMRDVFSLQPRAIGIAERRAAAGADKR